jgi:hypothetical protein
MIPNTFHFVFGMRPQLEPFHLMYYLCLASCLEVNRPDAVFFHYHEEPWGPWWERIKPALTLRRIEPEGLVADFRYEDPLVASFRHAHLADFARLEILAREGGIYADIDTLFLRPLPDAWRTREFILGREKAPPGGSPGGSLCNAWIASAPGAEFGRLWLDEMFRTFNGEWNRHSTLLPARLALEQPDLLHVEGEHAFFALDWTPEGIDALFVRSVDLPPDAYSLHLWDHLWGDPRRTDFSLFHRGLLTPDYVAFADTTYANNARAFLPSDVHASRVRYAAQCCGQRLAAPLRSAAAALRRHGGVHRRHGGVR